MRTINIKCNENVSIQNRDIFKQTVPIVLSYFFIKIFREEFMMYFLQMLDSEASMDYKLIIVQFSNPFLYIIFQ